MSPLLAAELRVRPEFFLRPQVGGDRPVFFRSLSSTLARDLAHQRAQMQRLQEIAAVIQHYVDLPTVDIPDVMAGASYKQLRDEDIEQIALDLRQHWKLGIGPCVDMVSLMERVGSIEVASGLCHDVRRTGNAICKYGSFRWPVLALYLSVRKMVLRRSL